MTENLCRYNIKEYAFDDITAFVRQMLNLEIYLKIHQDIIGKKTLYFTLKLIRKIKNISTEPFRNKQSSG